MQVVCDYIVLTKGLCPFLIPPHPRQPVHCPEIIRRAVVHLFKLAEKVAFVVKPGAVKYFGDGKVGDEEQRRCLLQAYMADKLGRWGYE